MTSTRLVADVGGTNTRIALYDEDRERFSNVSSFNNSDFNCLEDIIAPWLSDLDKAPPDLGCIAVAAPPSGDRVTITNSGWSFSCRELARRFGLGQLSLLNDFQANAHSLPYLGSEDLELVAAGRDSEHSTLATMGPGTGLGGATLRWVDGIAVACDSEPGHAGLSPATDLEMEIFRLLLPEVRNIYAELLVSGAGLTRLYRTIAIIKACEAENLSPAQVSKRALDGTDDNCVQALDVFCALLGSACGDFILSNGAYGGLFIAGGIIPRMTSFLRRSDFLQRFRAKGAMAEQLESVPVQVITNKHPGLIGAAHAPLQYS